MDKKGIVVQKFTNNLPEVDWARNILKRHNNLVSQRVDTNISQCHAEVSPVIVSEYFDNLNKVLENIPA